MATIWKLREFIDQHGITPNALATRTRGRLSRNAIYNLANPKEPPKRLEVATLDTLIPALREMTGEPVEITDLLEYRPEPVSASGLPYTGDPETDEILDDPEMTRLLLVRKTEYEGLTDEEIGAKIRAELASGRLIPLETLLARYGISDSSKR